MTLTELKKTWVDTPEYHKHIHELFIDKAKGTYLAEHRDWVRDHVFGFGEDSFPYMWELLCKEMPEEFVFCEIGCFKFQTVTLIKLIADHLGKQVRRVCVTPMDSSGGMWDEDYFQHAQTIHNQFKIPFDCDLLQGKSQEAFIVGGARECSPFDLLYIDGDHSLEGALFDLTAYGEMVKVGGYLVLDDAGCDLHQEFGVFQGIRPVTDAMDMWLSQTDQWEFQFSVVHIMVFKRVK